MLASGSDTDKPYFVTELAVRGVLRCRNGLIDAVETRRRTTATSDHRRRGRRAWLSVQSVIVRLKSVSVSGLRGLPDITISLEPVTALIGPRGSGKSRLLAAIAWLLSGRPNFDTRGRLAAGRRLIVSADVETEAGTRTITRGDGEMPTGDFPKVTLMSAHDRLPPYPEDAPVGWSDARQAEHMVAKIAERRLAGSEGELLLIEEPELMLIPQQQRHLYELLRRYAERNQVIYSTRSPALLDAAHYDEIVRLDSTADGTAVRRASSELLTEDERLRLTAEFDHERNEMFFASAVVLVEGQTERLSFPPIFRRLGADPDALGISIVEVSGKGNFALATRVLAELRIPHVIVHDTDSGRPGEQENDSIQKAAGNAPVFGLDPDFEAAAGIHGHEDKVLTAWTRFSNMSPSRIPKIFRKIVETSVALANGSSPAEQGPS